MFSKIINLNTKLIDLNTKLINTKTGTETKADNLFSAAPVINSGPFLGSGHFLILGHFLISGLVVLSGPILISGLIFISAFFFISGPIKAQPLDNTPVIQKKRLNAQNVFNNILKKQDNRVKIKNNKKISLTLYDAVMQALENNKELRVKKTAPLIKKQNELIRESEFDSVTYIQAQKDLLRNDILTPLITGAAKRGADSIEYGVSRKFLSGTRVDAKALTQNSWIDHGENNEFNTAIETRLTQPLKKGAGRVNTVFVGQARIDTKISMYELKGFIEHLVARTEMACWDLVYASKELEIFKKSLEIAAQQLEETKDRINVGLISSTELAAAEAELALRKEGLINASSDCEVACLKLNSLMGKNCLTPFEPETIIIDTPDLNVTIPNPDRALENAFANRPELMQAQLLIERQELKLVQTENGLLPRMDLFINLGKSGYSDSFSGSFKNLSKGSFDFTAGLYLEMPVKKRDRAEYDKSLFEKEQYILAVNNLKQLIRDEVLGTIIELRRARAQITATEATRLWQQETLRAEKEKLDVGISTIYLVSQAQRDLLEAQINEARAQINYQKFLIMHYKNEGTLLDLRGIKTDL